MACKNPTFDNWEKVCPDCGENCPSFDAMLKLAPILFALDTQLYEEGYKIDTIITDGDAENVAIVLTLCGAGN